MELFAKLYSSLLVFVYHCFDRIVIHGYLSGLSRPEQVVYFFREVLDIPLVNKDVLSRRTDDYRSWVEAFAGNHQIPIQWAEKGVRKEDQVLPALHRLEKQKACGVYFIFKSMEQGRTFRISVPKFPAQDPNYRIVAHQRSRFTHYYFYIRDQVLGPIILRVASFFPFHATYWLNGHSFMEQELNRKQIGFRKNDNAFLAVDDVEELQAAADRLTPEVIRKQLDYWTFILGPKFSQKERSQMNLSRFYAMAQIEYCRNFIFKHHFPIHKIFERSCEIGLWRLTANRISEIFGVRLNKRLRGKLATVIDQIEHGHHVFRAYWKNALLKQYEKFSRFLRNELCSNNLRDFGLKKNLDHLDAVRKRFQTITDRFAGFQAQSLNVHVDFPLLQRLALPITAGSVRYGTGTIHRMGPAKSFYGYSSRLRPWLDVHARSYDAIIVNGIWRYQSVGVWLALKGGSIPYYILPHRMLNPWLNRGFTPKQVKKTVFWWLAERRTLQNARAVIYSSEEESRLAASSYGGYRCRAMVLPLGTADPQSIPSKPGALSQYPELSGKRLVLFLGRLHPAKACDCLVQAFARSAADHSDIHLVMAGPDSEGWRVELEKLASSLGVADRITWTGSSTPDAELRDAQPHHHKAGSIKSPTVKFPFFMTRDHQRGYGSVFRQ